MVNPKTTRPAATAKKDKPSTPPSKPPGPAGRPDPVLNLVYKLQPNIPVGTWEKEVCLLVCVYLCLGGEGEQGRADL